MFFSYEPGVMVLRMNVNVKIWYFIRAKFCVNAQWNLGEQKFNKQLLNN